MRRRKFLACCLAGAVSGCTGLVGDESTPTPTPDTGFNLSDTLNGSNVTRPQIAANSSVSNETFEDIVSDPETPTPTPETGEEPPRIDPSDIVPEPTVAKWERPIPEGVSLDNSFDTYSAVVENSGKAGNVGFQLVWLPDSGTSPWVTLETETEPARQRYFAAGERREVEVTASRPEEYDGYGFRLWPAEHRVTVKNNGAEGDVTVELFGRNDDLGDFVIADKTVTVPEGGRKTVLFEVEEPPVLSDGGFEVRVDD